MIDNGNPAADVTRIVSCVSIFVINVIFIL